jgi:hypothetical protein
MKDAEKIDDPDKRKQELQRLAKEEEQLRKKAQDLSDRMGRERNARGAQAMQQVADQIKKSVEKLERDKPELEEAERDNQEALDRLNEARREVAQAREQAEDELAREQLAKVADEIKRLRARQEGMNSQTERIMRELLEAKMKREVLGRLLEIASAQGMEGLAQETISLADKKLESAPVFGKALRKIGDLMDEASLKMRDAVKNNDNGDGEEAMSRQKEILRRFDQILQAVKEEQGHMEAGGRADDGGDNPNGGGGGGGGGGAEGDGIPPLAQLKLLRQLQADINARTVEFRKVHPEGEKLDEKAQTELQTIRKEQQELADLLDELIQPDDPPADNPPQGAKPPAGDKPPQGVKP